MRAFSQLKSRGVQLGQVAIYGEIHILARKIDMIQTGDVLTVRAPELWR
jgi:hypothetical protein